MSLTVTRVIGWLLIVGPIAASKGFGSMGLRWFYGGSSRIVIGVALAAGVPLLRGAGHG